ncbi:MAG TPA: carboxypeptidase-like regulatory domain-containing protein, partial [Gemmatimonadaceae bacterium]|nr:carboxypeptidase-like regulatory domain-containing protein [Gemmatimonadaceae bacterium]
MLMRRWLHVVAVLAGLTHLAGTASVASAQRPQTIRGRVTTDSGAAIPAADVIVTLAPTAVSISAKSDSSGAYRVTIPNPTGEYILYIGAVGRKPFRQRVTIALADSEAVVNARLASAVTTVAAVQVQARKARPARALGGDNGFGADATDHIAGDGVNGALPPDVQANLDAMSTYIPGLALGPNGLSAFGLGTDANATTLNGLAFGGTDFPRDARVSTRFRTSPWDPTIGGFSGVQTAATLSSGGNVTSRRGHLTLDAPSLQFSDPVAGRLGQKYTNIAADEGGTGAFRLDKLFYNFGVHVARQTAAVSTLADLDPNALADAGIAPDSAERLTQLLGGYHVPITMGGIPRDRTTTTVSYLERFDLAPPLTPPSQAPGPIRSATVYAKYAESEAASLSPTIAPASSGKATSGLFGVQGLYSRFFGKDGDYISETTSGLSLSTTRGTPYLELPGGSVIVASADGIG